jgi:hypothetical protein
MGVACSIRGNRRRCRNRVDIDYPETGVVRERTYAGARTLEPEHRFCRILGANQGRCDAAGPGLVAPRRVRLATMVTRINPGAIRFGHARPIAGRAAATIACTTFVHGKTLPSNRYAFSCLQRQTSKSVSTFQAHRATPAAVTARRRCSGCHSWPAGRSVVTSFLIQAPPA